MIILTFKFMNIFIHLAQSSLSKNALRTWLYLYGIIDSVIPVGDNTLSFIYTECAEDLKMSESEVLKVLKELEKEKLIEIHTRNFPFPDSLEMTVHHIF